MSFKTILLDLSAADRGLQRLEMALKLARRFDAELHGLCAGERRSWPTLPDRSPYV